MRSTKISSTLIAVLVAVALVPLNLSRGVQARARELAAQAAPGELNPKLSVMARAQSERKARFSRIVAEMLEIDRPQPSLSAAAEKTSRVRSLTRIRTQLYSLRSELLQSGAAADRSDLLRLSQIQSKLRTLEKGTSRKTSDAAQVARTGSISGMVTAESTGAPLAGIVVYVVTFEPDFNTNVTTGADGRYVASGLPAASYTVSTLNDQGWVDEYYRDISCGIGSCFSRIDGQQPTLTLVPVSDGAAVSGISFSLARGVPSPGW